MMNADKLNSAIRELENVIAECRVIERTKKRYTAVRENLTFAAETLSDLLQAEEKSFAVARALSFQYWTSRGFVEQRDFPEEYTLLVKPSTMEKVRVYENGDVWKANTQTGEYELT